MTELRKAIILMLVFLAVFFNIERLDYSEQTLVDLHTFVYVLVASLIIITLYVRPLQKLTSQLTFTLWLGVYLALKLTFFNSRPFIGDVYTYLTVTEMAMTSIASLLTVNLSRSLNELEGIAEKTIMPKRNRRVKDLHEAEEDIKTELIRSRRYNRPLSVLTVEMDRVSMKGNIQQSFVNVEKLMMNRFVLASLGQTLTKVVRRTDVILEPDEQNGFILLCPETTTDGAALLAQRIQMLAQKDLDLLVQCGRATFPEEAVTFDDLLNKARSDMLETGDTAQLTIADPAIITSHKE